MTAKGMQRGVLVLGLLFGFSQGKAQIEAKLQAADGTRLGGGVSISGDYAIVNASGGARIYKRDSAGNWNEHTKLNRSGSVAISGRNAIVKSDYLYPFRREGEEWQPLQRTRVRSKWDFDGDHLVRMYFGGYDEEEEDIAEQDEVQLVARKSDGWKEVWSAEWNSMFSEKPDDDVNVHVWKNHVVASGHDYWGRYNKLSFYLIEDDQITADEGFAWSNGFRPEYYKVYTDINDSLALACYTPSYNSQPTPERPSSISCKTKNGFSTPSSHLPMEATTP